MRPIKKSLKQVLCCIQNRFNVNNNKYYRCYSTSMINSLNSYHNSIHYGIKAEKEILQLPKERSIIVNDCIKEMSFYDQTNMPLSMLIDISKNGINGLNELKLFLRNELPIWTSKRIIELQTLPYGLSDTKAINKLIDLYTKSFYMFKNINECDDNEFISSLLTHFYSTRNAVYLIQNGLDQSINMNNYNKNYIQSCSCLNVFLNKFHLNRIQCRLLTQHYVKLREQVLYKSNNNNSNNSNNILGLIDFECNPKYVFNKAIIDAQRICDKQYGRSPNVNITCDNNSNITIPYIADNLHYVFHEILKNSMAATMQKHPNMDDDLPDINVTIIGYNDKVGIKVSDEGCGIKRTDLDKIWFYSYTTNNNNNNINNNDSDIYDPPMNSFGYGLPLSKLYLQCLNGDIDITSIHDYGTHAYIHLDWIKDN